MDMTGTMLRMLRAILLALLLTGCGTPAVAAHDISGSLDLSGSDSFSTSGANCSGDGGYSDIDEGAQVTVKDQAGALIATGALKAGVADGSTCTFPFTVKAVPDATFYSVEVSHRGALNYSSAQMKSANWNLAFTLGE